VNTNFFAKVDKESLEDYKEGEMSEENGHKFPRRVFLKAVVAGIIFPKSLEFLSSPRTELAEAILDGCVRKELDENNFSPPHSVCIQVRQRSDGSIYEKPGVDTGEISREMRPEYLAGLKEINYLRLEGGKKPLSPSRLLTLVAEERVRQIIESGKFAHYDPEGAVWLPQVLEKFPQAPKEALYTEILGRTNDDKQPLNLIIEAFRKSNPHLTVILWGEARSLGVAVKRAPDGFFYFAGVFTSFLLD